jgi:mannitol-1-phosphate 5-dehydrogenase
LVRAGSKTYLGFGFGPIQAGLFLLEASASGNFERLGVAEIDPELVGAVREAGSTYRCNVAHADHVEAVRVGPVDVYNPVSDDERERLIAAVAEADEIGTALPSVAFYATADPWSPHRILAEGLQRRSGRGARTVLYAAENDPHAAARLQKEVLAEVPDGERDRVAAHVQFLGTVIGKMSRTVTDSGEMTAQELVAIAPGLSRAFLVESFNQIFVSKPTFDSEFHRGFELFEERADLTPFQEAKFYGLNGMHALAAYLGAVRGIRELAELRNLAGMLPFLRAAIVEESGAALLKRYAGLDPLFTPQGIERYADDLLARMTNAFLGDTVARVGRDAKRKLGWEDRLVGTMRLALHAKIRPRRHALGAAAALAEIEPALLTGEVDLASLLTPLWPEGVRNTQEGQEVINLIRDGARRLRRWRAGGYGDFEPFLGNDL